jgi:UDP-2-acetamido-3-amino-2,3-dideoxy-glucuronate N-acetyltransferase
MDAHETAQIEDSTLGDVTVREYVTIHDSVIDSDSRIYERVSVKKSTIGESVDINANSYIENTEIGDRVQIGPNASVVGVTHDLTAEGMEHRNDRFETIVLEDGAFVGAGAVVLPGIRVGRNAVIGANVTVTDNVAAGTVVRGPNND